MVHHNGVSKRMAMRCGGGIGGWCLSVEVVFECNGAVWGCSGHGGLGERHLGLLGKKER